MKSFRPTSAGVRFKTVPDFTEITRSRPEKSLVEKLVRSGGRNSLGHITSRFRGAGHKRCYRLIDFKRDKIDIPGKVAAIEYDPNRTARIALIHYADGEKRYIIAPEGLHVGGTIISAKGTADIEPGNTLLLSEIPVGTNIYNIELKPGGGGKMVRSAGTFAQLMAREGDYAMVKLPSNEVRKVLVTCRAAIGNVGNADHENMVIGKAGRMRWMGKRGHVRGTAMNPVDHPHGGGHGKDHGGRHPVSPTGVPTKGYKTRNNKRTDGMIVKDRRKK